MSEEGMPTKPRQVAGYPWGKVLAAGVLGAVVALTVSYFVLGSRRDRSVRDAGVRERPADARVAREIEPASAAGGGARERVITTVPGSPPPEETASLPADGPAPSVEPAVPAPVVADSPAVDFLVQVSSNRRRELAEAALEELKRSGYAAEIWEVEIPGRGKWYRVIAGSFDTEAAAQELAAELRRVAKWHDARIIRRRR